MDKLAIFQEKSIIERKLEISAVGIDFKYELTTKESEYIWDKVGKINSAIQWWIGDMWNAAADTGEAERMSIENGFRPGAAQRYGDTAKKFALHRRRGSLSYFYHQFISGMTEEEQEKWLDYAEKTRCTLTEFKKKINRGRPKLDLPEGTFEIVYSDPPWEYQNTGFDESANNQYPTMSVEELTNLKVNRIINKNTVLFLWATNPLLEDAIEVMHSWGFEYMSNIAWIKDRGRGKGWWLRSKHELLLIGTLENSPQPAVRLNSCFEAARPPRHSQKPDIVYEMIEKMYPKQTKMEMFARQTRKGWSSWGNEVTNQSTGETINVIHNK